MNYAGAVDFRVGARTERLLQPTVEKNLERGRQTISPSGVRILIVDDEANLRDGLASFVAQEGYDTRVAGDGSAALALATSWLPDVVISDLAMPNMGGIELCSRLHELDPDLPVIILTALEREAAGLACLQAGAEDYLSKPVEVAAVAWCIQRALERRASQREREQLKARADELCQQLRSVNEHLVVRSIREQERVEAEERRQAELNALLQRLGEGIVVVDVSGEVRMINDAACTILGVDREQVHVAALDALELHEPHGRRLRSDERPLRRALNGEEFAGYDVGYVLPDGQQLCLETTGTSVRDAHGEVALAIVVFRDVTKLRLLEQHREEYAALISHDLRTPLSIVLMSTELLRESPTAKLSAKDMECIGRIERNSRRMTAMLDELTEATSLEQNVLVPHRAPCNVGALLFDVIAQLDDSRARRVSVEVVETAACHVLADSLQITRCITNLLTNALKYSAADAPVRIRILRTEHDVQLEVIDYGVGIPPESRAQIFDRYHRTDAGRAQAEGLGLGLYITRLIIEAHGGRIDVRSEIGRGSTFTLTLPLLPAASADDSVLR